MPAHRRPQLPGAHGLARALVLTAAATTALGVTVGGSAYGAPEAPADPSAHTADVKTRVELLYDEAERASEQANAALDQQKRLQAEASALQAQVARGRTSSTASASTSRRPPPRSTGTAASTRPSG